MTLIVSVLGVAGRVAGDLLSSALGWASSLLFGRVPRTHERWVLLMLFASVLWLIALVGLLIPTVAAFYAATTPFVQDQWLGTALLGGVIALPLVVGAAGFLVPAAGSRPAPIALVRELARGYVLAPVLVALLAFLGVVGMVRKARSRRHRWSDVHVAIVSEPEPHRYDELVDDLLDGLTRAGLDVQVRDAPRILSAPAWLLTRVSGENVRRLRPERLVELAGRNLRVGVYPSDIAISGTDRVRTRARAAIAARLVASTAHLTTTAEGQRIEDALRDLAASRRRSAPATGDSLDRAFEPIDEQLLDIEVPTDEWDLLYRLRLQAERDLLIGAQPGTVFPGARAHDARERQAADGPRKSPARATTSDRTPDAQGRPRQTSPDPSP